MFLYIKKSERIEAFSIRKETRGFIHEECFDTHIGNSVLKLSGWCNGSMTVSKTVRGGSSPSLDAKIWAGSDNGSTGALQAFSRGSIPRRSTKYGCVGKLVTPGDCKSSVVMALLVQVQPHPPYFCSRLECLLSRLFPSSTAVVALDC